PRRYAFTRESNGQCAGLCLDLSHAARGPRLAVFTGVPQFWAKYGSHATLEAGATLILQPDFDLTTVLDAVVQHGITMVFGVPTIFALLYAHASPEQMRSVRLCLSAAAPLPLALSRQWQSKFGLPISEGYGLT